MTSDQRVAAPAPAVGFGASRVQRQMSMSVASPDHNATMPGPRNRSCPPMWPLQCRIERSAL